MCLPWYQHPALNQGFRASLAEKADEADRDSGDAVHLCVSASAWLGRRTATFDAQLRVPLSEMCCKSEPPLVPRCDLEARVPSHQAGWCNRADDVGCTGHLEVTVLGQP